MHSTDSKYGPMKNMLANFQIPLKDGDCFVLIVVCALATLR